MNLMFFLLIEASTKRRRKTVSMRIAQKSINRNILGLFLIFYFISKREKKRLQPPEYCNGSCFITPLYNIK